MERWRNRLVALFVAGLSATCSNKSPTGPSGTNHNPTLSAMSVQPSSGMSQITSISYSATATDSDGDNLSYSWAVTGGLAGSSGSVIVASGKSGSVVIPYAGSGNLRVTVTDGKGGSVSDSRSLVLGSLSGNWRGPCSLFGQIDMSLSQSGTSVTGNFASGASLLTIDTSRPHTVNAAGHTEFRMIGGIEAYDFKGDLNSSFSSISGTVTDVSQVVIGPGICSFTVNKLPSSGS